MGINKTSTPSADWILLINGNFLYQRITGTQRFATEISKVLLCHYDNARIIVAGDFELPDWIPNDRVMHIPINCHLRLIRYFVFWIIAPFFVRIRVKEKYVVWSPCNTGSPLFKNHLVTFHDMATRHNPKWYSLKHILVTLLTEELLIKTGAKITTVSSFSKSEIVRHLKIDENSISLTPNGFSLQGVFNREEMLEPNQNIPDIFLLSVASMDPKKNLDIIVRAWLSIPTEKRKGAGLVFAGGKNTAFGKLSGLTHGQEDGIIWLGYVSDAQLAWLYSRSKGVILASSYEGFGLPIVEALAYGVRVVCSDIPAFREVGKDSVVYFSLDDVHTLTKRLINLLQNEIPHGKFDASLIPTWEQAADAVWKAAASAF